MVTFITPSSLADISWTRSSSRVRTLLRETVGAQNHFCRFLLNCGRVSSMSTFEKQPRPTRTMVGVTVWLTHTCFDGIH